MEKNQGDEVMSRDALLIREMRRRHHIDGYI